MKQQLHEIITVVKLWHCKAVLETHSFSHLPTDMLTSEKSLYFMQYILCGRLVLSAVSDYFAAMFTSDVREAKQEEIKMEGVDPEALRSLVHFAYTGEFHEEIHQLLFVTVKLLNESAFVLLFPTYQLLSYSNWGKRYYK